MSTATAPSGGHTDRSATGSTGAEDRIPVAWQFQAESAVSLENTDMPRWPASSAAPTTTCTATEPDAGNSNGDCRVNSSTWLQPTSSPARIANSTKPAPGNTATPSTA